MRGGDDFNPVLYGNTAGGNNVTNLLIEHFRRCARQCTQACLFEFFQVL